MQPNCLDDRYIRGSTQVGGAVYEGLVLICNETQHVMGFTQFRKVRRA